MSAVFFFFNIPPPKTRRIDDPRRENPPQRPPVPPVGQRDPRAPARRRRRRSGHPGPARVARLLGPDAVQVAEEPARALAGPRPAAAAPARQGRLLDVQRRLGQRLRPARGDGQVAQRARVRG